MIKFLGIMFSKMSAERFLSAFDDLKINSSLSITEIEENEGGIRKENEKVLNVSFSYTIDYSKGIAKIDLGGKLIISVDSETEKDLMKKWKKKEIEDSLRVRLLNMILVKSNIKALDLEDQLGLPIHFRMPSIGSPKK